MDQQWATTNRARLKISVYLTSLNYDEELALFYITLGD